MQKPKYWIYNTKTNSGRELFYGKDFVIGLYGKELFVDGVFPSSDGEAYLIHLKHLILLIAQAYFLDALHLL